MAKRRRGFAPAPRRTKSCLALAALLVALVVGYINDETAESGGNPAALFAVFARLNIDFDTLRRMHGGPAPLRAKPASLPWRTVAEVIDGDSVRLDGGETVRLLGIDAPEASANNKLYADIGKMSIRVDPEEMVFLGREAAKFARELARGKRCWIEREGEDQYNRSLGYVHLEDGTILNEAMLGEGYAKVYMPQNFAHKRRYILIQAKAGADGRGLWGLKPRGEP